MNNERYNQIIDEAHKNYLNETLCTSDTTWLESLLGMNTKTGEIGTVFRQYAKKDFIDKIKTDQEFSERWGLNIEEKELSQSERIFWIMSNRPEQLGSQNYLDGDGKGIKSINYDGVPTKLITLTYNNEKIESYE